MSKKLLLTLLPIVLLLTRLEADTGRDIMQKVVDAQAADSSAMDMRMVLIDRKGGVSTRRIQTLVRNVDGLTQTIVVFLEPASVKNTRFLTIENESRNDDQWIYLPALRKVKRIAAGEKDGSFMGSDFSYSDMSFAGSPVDDSVHTLLREETLEGVNCAVVESVPRPGTNSSYGKTISWVDTGAWIPRRVDLYSTDGRTLMKQLVQEDITQVGGRWTAGKITMTTVASEHRTIMEVLQVKYDISLDSAYFTTRFLQTGRVR